MQFTFVDFNSLSLSDLYAILQLRQDVFILEQTCLYADIDGKDKQAYHIMLKIDDELIAYARYFIKGNFHSEYASIGRVLVHPNYRKKQYGDALLEYLLKEVETRFEETSIKISAQSYLLEFYEKYGFKKISAEYLEDGIPHIDMLKV